MAGRTNNSNVTADDTGLPGRPNTRTWPAAARALGAVPNANGLPGWTATRQRSTRPIVSIAVLTTSYGPTDTPPDTISASAPASSPRRSRARTSSSSSLAIPRSIGVGARGGHLGPQTRAVGVGDAGRPERLARARGPRRRSRGRRPSADGGRGAARRRRRRAARHRRRRSPTRRSSSAAPARRSLPSSRTDPPTGTDLVDETRGGQRPGRVAPARTVSPGLVDGRGGLDRDDRVRTRRQPAPVAIRAAVPRCTADLRRDARPDVRR